jgi:uncharacterized protein (DUF3084 family)
MNNFIGYCEDCINFDKEVAFLKKKIEQLQKEIEQLNEHIDCPYNYLVAQEGLRDHEDQCKLLVVKQHEFEDRFTRLSLDHDKYYDAYHELKDAAIALVERLECDKDVKENNWWLNERAKIMEVIIDGAKDL